MLASVTRLRVRSFLNLPSFLWMTLLTQRQIQRSRGFIAGRLLVDRYSTYWTLTAWTDEKAMRGFRGSGPHARAMPKLVEWCDEAAYAHWTITDDAIPDWTEAHERLVSDGRLSRVAYPSENHSSRRFPKPRLRPLIGLELKAVGTGQKGMA